MSIAHLTLATRDVRATSEFFQRTFRWQPIRRPGNSPIEVEWLQIAPGQQLHVLKVEDFEPSPFEKEFGRHLALFHPGDDMEPLKDRLREAGAELLPPLRDTPFPRFFFRDPNGYMFEVIDQNKYVIE